MDKDNDHGLDVLRRNLIDAYSPREMAHLVENAGLAKVKLPLLSTLVLGFLAGVFIAYGAMFFTLVMTDNTLGYGAGRLLGGLAFSLGLILVVVAGAELFTGNNLIAMAWTSKKVTTSELLRNWLLVYLANFAGTVTIAALYATAGGLEMAGGAIAASVSRIGEAKLSLSFMEAFTRGILCNSLVCLAVWLCYAAHSVSSKILAIIFPITAFVALGFEHSVANMYLFSIAWFANNESIPLIGVIANLVPVTLGNIVGGSLFVGLTYWVVYLRHDS